MSVEKLLPDEQWQESRASMSLPRYLDFNIPADRCYIRLFQTYLKVGSNKTVFEIGCAPGKYLSYFATEFNCKLFGIELTEAGIDVTKRNFEILGINGNLIQGDFLTHKPDCQFDCVLSLGFIEHFSEELLEDVLHKHAVLVKQGGVLFLEMPNMTYFNKALLRWFAPHLLSCHNTSIMNEDFFRQFTRRYGFDIQYLGYFGGFHPAGFRERKGESSGWVKSFVSRAAAPLVALRQFEFMDHINSKYFSHNLGAVLKKK